MKRSELKQIIKEVLTEERDTVDPKDRQKMIMFMKELSKLEKKFQCRVAVIDWDGVLGVVTKDGSSIGLSQSSHEFGKYDEEVGHPTYDTVPLVS